MKKKTLRIVAAFLAVVLVGAVWSGVQLKNGREYFVVLRLNWDVSLPANAKQIYESQGEPNIHGDGERYHVFRYDKTPDFSNTMVPVTAVPQGDREDALNILSKITVDKEYLLDFDAITLQKKAKKTGSTRLYLYYAESSKTLYIIEHFL